MKADAAGGKPAQSLQVSGSKATPLVQPEAGSGSRFVPVLSPPSILTVREVAARLRVSTATVYKLAASGALPYFRVSSTVRIAEPDLIAFVAQPRVCQKTGVREPMAPDCSRGRKGDARTK